MQPHCLKPFKSRPKPNTVWWQFCSDTQDHFVGLMICCSLHLTYQPPAHDPSLQFAVRTLNPSYGLCSSLHCLSQATYSLPTASSFQTSVLFSSPAAGSLAPLCLFVRPCHICSVTCLMFNWNHMLIYCYNMCTLLRQKTTTIGPWYMNGGTKLLLKA